MPPRPSKARELLIAALPKAEFGPNLAALSRETGIPVSTLHDCWRRLQAEGLVRVTVQIAEPRVEWKTIEPKQE